jgi:hypothetical protein
MIIRPAPSKVSEGVDPMCRVVSKIDPALGNRRAIAENFPYSFVKQWFKSEDGDAVEVYAELSGGDGGHLEIYERASKRDFFLHEAKSSFPAH